MKYYFCHKCQEDHAVLEECDLAERAVQCDIHGHEGKCCTEPSKVEPWYWCAFCARQITKEQYELARLNLEQETKNEKR